MATPLPPRSCFSCGDSSPSTTASVTGILTFFSAIAVSLSYFLSQALEASFREVDEFMKTVKQELEVIRNPAAGYIAEEVRRIQYQIESQFDSLSTLADKFNPRYYDSRMKRWRHRIQFVLVQDELRGKVAEKDKLMEDLRRIQHRIEKLRQDEQNEHPWAEQRERQEDLLRKLSERIEERLDALETAQRGMNEALITTTRSMGRTQNPQTGAGADLPGYVPPGDSDAVTI